MALKKYRLLLIKLVIGIVIIAAIWWFLKCECLNLKAFAPASIRDYIKPFGRLAVPVYIAAYILNTVSVLPPIAPLSLSAGLIFGVFWGAIYLMIAAMIGTSLTFVISRYFARGIVDSVLKGNLKRLDEKLAENGFLAVLFFRAIPVVPYEVLNYACGLSKIRFKDYFFATLIGLVPGVIIAAFFGGRLGEIRVFQDIMAPKFLIAAGLMALAIVVPVIYRIIRKRDRKS